MTLRQFVSGMPYVTDEMISAGALALDCDLDWEISGERQSGKTTAKLLKSLLKFMQNGNAFYAFMSQEEFQRFQVRQNLSRYYDEILTFHNRSWAETCKRRFHLATKRLGLATEINIQGVRRV